MLKDYRKLQLEEALRYYLREEDLEIVTETIAFWFDDEYTVIPLRRMLDKTEAGFLIDVINELKIMYTITVDAGEVQSYMPVDAKTLERYFNFDHMQYKAFCFIFDKFDHELFEISVEHAYEGRYIHWPTRDAMLKDYWVSEYGGTEENFRFISKDAFEYAVKGDWTEVNGEYWIHE